MSLRKLFSLETLDTRFFIPATVPPKEALEEIELDPATNVTSRSGRSRDSDPRHTAQPSRWNTPEYYVWILIVLASIPMMMKSVIEVSRGWYDSIMSRT